MRACRNKVKRTSLTQPTEKGDSMRIEAGDGPIWVVAWGSIEAPVEAPAR